MKKLIVNADDFGFTRSVNAAIVRAFKEGIVTSTTIMANGDAFEDAMELARASPGLGVGCHLSLAGGRPVSAPRDVPSLVDSQGMMPRSLTRLMIRLTAGAVRSSDVEREFSAQAERVIQGGVTPTHFDTHKHSHTHPRVMRALARVACEFGVKCVRNPFEPAKSLTTRGPRARTRIAVFLKQYATGLAVSPFSPRFKRLARTCGLTTPDRFYGVALTGLLDSEVIGTILKSLGPGTAELMCHPGTYGDELERAPTRLKHERQAELDAMTDPRLRRIVEEEGISLITYRNLR